MPVPTQLLPITPHLPAIPPHFTTIMPMFTHLLSLPEAMIVSRSGRLGSQGSAQQEQACEKW
ncbi:MAG TPA: hypothetical protein VG817_10495 [Gemmatimonadales bacterium]|nr:hypothetical protein [Gemmatimonadales bacterium]